MADQLRHFSDAQLEGVLTDLGAHLAYPPTPNLSRVVGDRLRARPGRPWWSIVPPDWGRRELALAVAVLVLALAAALGSVPGVRSAIADRLGLRGIEIRPTPTLSPAPSLTAPPDRTSLRLGQPVTLGEAHARVQYRILEPTLVELGAPDEVYYSPSPAGGQVSFIYLVRPGLPASPQTGVGMLLTEFRGTVGRDSFLKAIGPGTKLDSVTVNGSPGFWIEGAPHLFYFYSDANGQSRSEEARLAGNVLLWQQGSLTLRLEGVVNKDQALRIAQSVR